MSKMLPRFSVNQPVLVNLLMLGIFLGGLFALMAMPQELNPNISFNWAFVTILYPGASPQEVEDLIIIPGEKELDKIDSVDEILATAGEGFGFFFLKFKDMSDSDFTVKLQEVRIQIDNTDLPNDIEDPIIEDFGSDDFMPIVAVGVTSDGDPKTASLIIDDLAEDIERIADVAKVQVSGLEDREIWVEVDPMKLNAHNLTLGGIVQALNQRNINFPGGNITIGRSEFQIRALSRFTSPEEINDLVLKIGPSGGIVYLGDVATVREARAERSTLSRLNGKNAVSISVSKSAQGSTFAIAGRVKELVKQYRAASPEGIEYTITIDSTRHISRILSVLRNNALIGISIIFIILLIFLGRANALLAALGIPLSFMITFILMKFTGNTINGSSVFAMIVVLGIIVDDAIIVLENVHCHRQLGKPLREAVIDGTSEVVSPVTSGILTTIAAFLPLMLLPGIMGKFMRVIPLVVSLALAASLFEALVMLPSHIHDWTGGSTRHMKPEFRGYLWLRERYERIVRRFMKRRYLVMLVMTVILGGSLALIPLVGIQMFGEENLDFFTILIKLPEGTTLEETDRIISKIESAALNLPATEISYIEATPGLYQGNDDWIIRNNVGQVLVSLIPDKAKRRPMDEIIASLRDSIATVSGLSSLKFEKPSSGPPSAPPVSLRLTGKYFSELERAVADIKAVLSNTEGVYDIRDDFPGGKQEIRFVIDDERAALYGLTPREIAIELRTAIGGVKATTYREGDEDIDIIVKFQEEAINSLAEIRSLQISTKSGTSVPLSDVAEISIHDSVTEIKRRNLKRTIIVGADIDKSVTSVDRAIKNITPVFDEIRKRYEEVDVEIGGEFEEFNQAFNDIGKLFAIGLMLMYLILGTQFRSYIQPLVILCTIPFAFIGAMVGLLVCGDKFGIVTLFGVVALAGIVVNDAIVMISFINAARQNGLERWESIVSGGTQRLRPIILTSVTTIGGLLPTVLGIGGTSNVWRPLANTITFGLIASTLLTLLIIPCILAIIDDLKVKLGMALIKER
ncbi:MAG: efflux RND transporter permease subunit [Candidatus Eisenbacteria bacterium]|uniref:Efflux RND transporter permease subunit n=1 Tax=Eiseniibacteriota bacterium TaxID=2212470 RepID=A0A948RZ09_UNCEI|nr:efflux RND transporter permease subunit [Candidatus Eisenbacteria bacterium]MBU1948329.1 efflux RND transporter permease subunit [Candidatus Eisenbacteria bacterium]MBU2692222.1 efflux RND transporter permease subunit [Candidatus Eisenbacteria bacterium]